MNIIVIQVYSTQKEHGKMDKEEPLFISTLKLKKIAANNKHLLILLYYIVMWFGYRYLNKTTVPEIYLYSPIDDYIPFVKEMVIPYISWYGYIVLPLIYFAFKSPKDFTRLCIFMFAGMTISYLIFWILPNGQNLRPEVLGNDVFSNILKGIYASDNPTNSLPSMHVIDAVAVHASIAHSRKLKNKPFLQNSSFIACIMICVSTVMVKQHSILDVFAGLVVTWILYQMIYELDLAVILKSLSVKRKSVKVRRNTMALEKIELANKRH